MTRGALLGLAILCACNRAQAPVVVERPRPVVTDARGESAQKCLERAQAAGKFRVALGGVTTVGERALKLRVDAEHDADSALVRARFEDFAGTARPIVQNGQSNGSMDALLAALCADLGERLRIAYGTDAEVIAAVKSTNDVERDEAIATAAERHLKDAVPGMLPWLKGDDEDVRDLVIGALRELRDPRGVKPLTEISRFGDIDALPKIFDALSEIGGPEARAYLDFVASSHPHPETKTLAKRALDKLDKTPAKLSPDTRPR